LYEDYTEIRYTEPDSAKHSFSKPTTGRLPKTGKEVATCTRVLDDFGLPHELGTVLHLKIYNGVQMCEEDFVLCGFWEKPAATMVNQIYVSKEFQEAVAPAWENTSDEKAHIESGIYAGAVNAEFNFPTVFHLERQMEQLKNRLGFGPEVNDGVNWAYLTADIDPTAVILAAFLLLLIMSSGYLIIYNIFYIAVSADIRYYGLLKTVGMTDRQLKKLVIKQAFILSVIAVPCGLLFGYVLSVLVFPMLVNAMLNVPCIITFNGWIMLFSAMFSWITVRISCIKPCRIIGKISPVEAVRFQEYAGELNRKTKRSKKVTPVRMAWENLKRKRKKTIAVMISIALSVIVMNATVSITESIDKDAYIQHFAVSDFMVADGSVMNVSVVNDNLQGVSVEDMEYFLQTPGLTDNGAVYMAEGWHEFAGEPYERMKSFYEMHKDWFAYGEEPYWQEQFIYEEQEIACHLYGVSRFPFEKMELVDGKLDWEKFSSGKYAVVSTPIVGELEGTFYQVGETIPVKMPDEEVIELEVLALGDIPYAMGPQHSHGLDIYITVLDEEYLKHSPESDAAMKLCFDVEDDKLQEAEEYVSNYCSTMKPELGYESKLTYAKDFDDMIHMFLVIGGALSFILALIGILNFINLTYTSIQERRPELTILKSIGMTKRQLATMLTGEGVLRIGLTFVIVFTVGIFLNQIIVLLIAGQMFMFSYKLVIWPMLACIPLFMALAFAIPRLVIRNVTCI
jgi:putative ABC transport system permease protein